MTIDTSKKILTLKGDVYKHGGTDLTVGAVIAEALATSNEGEKTKLYSLAQKSFSEKSIEVDEADFLLIKNALKKCAVYNNIIIGQTLLDLEK